MRAAHPTRQIRGVVDDLSLRQFDDHNRAAQEIEQASMCLGVMLTQAGCEVAVEKSKVLRNSVSVRTRLQVQSAPLGLPSSRAERNLGIGLLSGTWASTLVPRARLQLACQTDPWQVFNPTAATGGDDWGRGCSSTVPRCSRAWLSGCTVRASRWC